MPQRLTPLEVSLLALDTARTPGHVGTVTVLEPGPGQETVDHAGLTVLVADRLHRHHLDQVGIGHDGVDGQHP